MEAKSQSASTCPDRRAAAGISIIVPPVGSPAALPRAANHEASLGVATIGAITHTSADVDRRAAARASS